MEISFRTSSRHIAELFVLLLAGFEQSAEAVSFPRYLAAHVRCSGPEIEKCSASLLQIRSSVTSAPRTLAEN